MVLGGLTDGCSVAMPGNVPRPPALPYRIVAAGAGPPHSSTWAPLVQAATRSPDVILLDLGLPDLDGLRPASVRVARRLAAMGGHVLHMKLCLKHVRYDDSGSQRP